MFETEYLIAVPANSHQKIVWFNVSMNEVLVVDIFHSSNHLQHRNTNIERQILFYVQHKRLHDAYSPYVSVVDGFE